MSNPFLSSDEEQKRKLGTQHMNEARIKYDGLVRTTLNLLIEAYYPAYQVAFNQEPWSLKWNIVEYVTTAYFSKRAQVAILFDSETNLPKSVSVTRWRTYLSKVKAEILIDDFTEEKLINVLKELHEEKR